MGSDLYWEIPGSLNYKSWNVGKTANTTHLPDFSAWGELK